VKAKDFVSENPGAFVDVPKSSPLYEAVLGLDEAGFFTGYPGVFSGKRVLIRFEFAVATQRLCQSTSRAVEAVEKGQVPFEASISCEFPLEKQRPPTTLLSTFQDSEKLTHAFARLQTLVTEFGPELKLLKADPEQLRKETAIWLRKTGKLSAQAKALKAPQSSQKGSSENK
jgi:hypothetical protein